jgi:hypothetical protein
MLVFHQSDEQLFTTPPHTYAQLSRQHYRRDVLTKMPLPQVWPRNKKGARQTHKRPSRLHLNSACTSVDHLLTRQERRSPNLGDISHAVNV